ncbi:hypothetical protein POM88_004837 [Heracleum sosnowskyi]|uniref:F-box domain-containing protein n=1 Tax=Heracleum sosnowskyi TaxID=360622 RepID=A0AAD8JIU3_9APIA|nr:hypothetical protein POM88_004837 [Heracleum sosnowskyi]
MELTSSPGSYLPDNLIEEIIRRLNVKDLLRFMSVNKSWYDFINASSFIKSTISNTSHNNRYLLYAYNDDDHCCCNDRYLLSTHDDDDKDLSEGDEDEVILPDNISRDKFYYIGTSPGDNSTWEMQVTIKLGRKNMSPSGFTKHGKYLLRDYINEAQGTKYLWDFGTEFKKCTCDMEKEDLRAIDYLVGNLVLVDEKNLDPFVEMKPCSTQTMFKLHRLPSLRVTDMLDTTRNRMQGRRTNWRIEVEQTDIEKSRKMGGKEKLDSTKNGLQGRGTKRRKEDQKWRMFLGKKIYFG